MSVSISELTSSSQFYCDFDDFRHINDEPDHRSIEVKITEEGVIIDAWENSGQSLVGTFAMTYEELHDWLTAR